MPFAAHVFRVMIASPSGLSDEREAVRSAVFGWNCDHSEDMGIAVLPMMWETDTRPSFGEHPQAVINRSVVDQCDLLVGFFGETLGTQTPSAASGTVEEIQRVHEAGKPVLLYFGRRHVESSGIDLEKLKALREFKEWCRERSLYGEFTDAANLARQVEKHLLREMREIRFPPINEPPTLPARYEIVGDTLTVLSRVERPDHFATEPDRKTCILEAPLVLLSSLPVTNSGSIVPVLEQTARSGRGILLLAPSIAGEALATLELNAARRTLSCCAATLGEDRDTLLAIRDFTGAEIIGDFGTRLENGGVGVDLGRADKIIVEPHRTRIWKSAT